MAELVGSPQPPPHVPDAQELYQMGFRTGHDGGMPICPANTDAQGEAIYNAGLEAGKKAKAQEDLSKMPSARQSTPDEYIETRDIMMLSDDKVGVVTKRVTGTKKQLDELQEASFQQINAQQLDNLMSVAGGVAKGRADTQGIGQSELNKPEDHNRGVQRPP